MEKQRPYEAVVQPQEGLGPFFLGSPINTVIAFLKENFELFPSVDFVYNSENPLGQDLLLNIEECCLQLRFDPIKQCLKAIEVYGFENIRLKYQDQSFGGPEQDYGFDKIHQTFGITRADFKPKLKAYVLDYPGLQLSFTVPDQYVQTYAHTQDLLAQQLTLPDGQPALLSSLIVFSGSKADRMKLVPDRVRAHYFEQVDLRRGRGLEFLRRDRSLHFGETCQDTISLLGPPHDVFFKSEDRTRIFNSRMQRDASSATDFFYNYPALGIDVLFDGGTKRIKKFVLHSNVPGHFDFSRYSKCNFKMTIFTQQSEEAEEGREGSERVEASVVREQPHPQSTLTLISLDDDDDDPASLATRRDHITITPDTEWETVRQALGHVLTKEVVYNQPLTPNSSNPFGPTTLWGIEGAIFEVISTGHIATITLFAPSDLASSVSGTATATSAGTRAEPAS